MLLIPCSPSGTACLSLCNDLTFCSVLFCSVQVGSSERSLVSCLRDSFSHVRCNREQYDCACVRFPGAKLNTCYNCLDRHVEDGAGDQTALIYDCAYTGQVNSFTYKRLTDRVRTRSPSEPRATCTCAFRSLPFRSFSFLSFGSSTRTPFASLEKQSGGSTLFSGVRRAPIVRARLF